MIIARAPLHISFAGEGTDLPSFYTRYPGRVISAAIGQYVYAAVNRTPLIKQISIRYPTIEAVSDPENLTHSNIKAVLASFGIQNNTEIGSFSSVSGEIGLGFYASFSVALAKALGTLCGKKLGKREVAEAVCRLGVKDDGRADQYTAAFGGFNSIQFNGDHSVEVKPVLLDYKKRLGLESHVSIYFTGVVGNEKNIPTELKSDSDKNFNVLKEISDSANDCSAALLAGDFRSLDEILHDAWVKKNLSHADSGSAARALHEAGMKNGAWGGEVLGKQGKGPCVMFVSPPDSREAIRKAVAKAAADRQLKDFQEIPIRFVQSGAEVLFNGDHHYFA